jgi:Flp pilus assembly protein protease CpaA
MRTLRTIRGMAVSEWLLVLLVLGYLTAPFLEWLRDPELAGLSPQQAYARLGVAIGFAVYVVGIMLQRARADRKAHDEGSDDDE